MPVKEHVHPELSKHFQARQPSPIRLAQIEHMRRPDAASVKPINTAIGNVSLPMHPAMQERMFNLDAPTSPFKDGVVQYTATKGTEEAQHACLNILRSSGLSTEGLYVQITDGGSPAMELMILGVCGEPGTGDKPLFEIDAAYSNYGSMAERTGREIVAVQRTLQEDGTFTLPQLGEIEKVIKQKKPGALLVIPYDNPTGQFYTQEAMNELAKLCVKHNIWMVSDEAYRELYYTDDSVSSIWGITEDAVPGITGRRISIESASKVWNACGLRIGALITDNETYHQACVNENTANLCANAIGQYIFGALANEPIEKLQAWYQEQRAYYKGMSQQLTAGLKALMPELVVSRPDAAIYSVVDVKNVVKPNFDMKDFVMFCAKEGKVEMNGETLTLLVAPMAGFYSVPEGEENPGTTQLRIAYVETPEKMALVPELFVELLKTYEAGR